MALLYKLQCILPVNTFSFTLAVWAVRAAFRRTFIGHQPAPFETAIDIFFCSCNVSCLVGIFYSQNELPAMLMGKQVIIKNGTNPAKV